MKKIITLYAALFMTANIFAQSPERMSYQAVVRDGSNNLVTSSTVGMQISILKGSSSGTAVYVEIQSPISNANGLVSIEIGGGTIVSGTFASIDWANGPYFIKSETDPTGGANYTISGTSQLLSVPYALHAKTAETLIGTITEADPIFGASVAGGITGTNINYWNNKLDNFTETDPIFGTSAASGIASTDITYWNNKLNSYTETDPIFNASIANGITGTDTAYWNNKLDNFTETDPIFGASVANGITGTDLTYWNNKLDSYTETDPIFSTSVAYGITGTDTAKWNNKQDQLLAGTNISITGNIISATGPAILTIGQSYQGGIIFWLDASGQHGLIAAPINQGTSVQWNNGTIYTVTNAVKDGIYAGKFNTERIISNQGLGSYAAQLCANYTGGNYGDWYLPSIYELNLLYQQRAAVGAIGVYAYWSSTETIITGAVRLIFVESGALSQNSGKNATSRVRAIRAF